MNDVNFLDQKVLSSPAVLSNENRGYIESLIELKLADKKPEEVTFDDLVKYTSRKIKSGLKCASFHKRAVLAIKEIFQQNAPETANTFNKILPVRLQRQQQVA